MNEREMNMINDFYEFVESTLSQNQENLLKFRSHEYYRGFIDGKSLLEEEYRENLLGLNLFTEEQIDKFVKILFYPTQQDLEMEKSIEDKRLY